MDKAVVRREPWWKASKVDVGGIVTQTHSLLLETSGHKTRTSSIAVDRSLFESRGGAAAAAGPSDLIAQAARQWAKGETMAINVTRSIVMTVLSRVASRQRPKPVFMATGASFSQRLRARKANRFLEAVFRDANVDGIAEKVFRAAMIDDTGFVHAYIHGGRICCDVIDSADVLVDPVEGRHERPMSLYVTRIVDRGVLLAMASDGDERLREKVRVAIRDAKFEKLDTDSFDYAESPCADPVRVVEAWRLSTSADAEDGRHVIAIGDAALVDESLKLTRFPIVALRWESAVSGFYGWSLVRTLRDVQMEIAYVMGRIRRGYKKLGAPKLLIQQGSLKNEASFTNETGEVVEFTGDIPPTVVVPSAIGSDAMGYLEFLLGQAFDLAGVSRMQATSQKPAGLTSGEALREYNDTGDDRLTFNARAYERFHLDLAQVFVDLLKSSDGVSVYAPERRGGSLRKLSWQDVSQDVDDYILSMQPTSMLARDFGTRKQQLADLVAGGMMSKEDMMRLLELPDLDDEIDIRNAPRELADLHCELMLDDGIYRAPHPIQDLAYAKQRADWICAREEVNGEDIDNPRLELLRNYSAAADDLLAKAAAAMNPPAAPAPMPMAPAGADPMMQPAPAQVMQ